MNFNISFFNIDQINPLKNYHKNIYGEILLGNFKETFESSLSFWSINAYKRQWNDAITRIVNGENKVCLVTSMNDPEHANFIIWWPIYNEGNQIYFHNSLFFFKDLKEQFDENNIYKYVPDHSLDTESKYKISEWKLEIESLINYLNVSKSRVD
jgi:hypothetical protein